MIQVKIIPNGIPNRDLADTRVLVVSESGEEWDISHIVTAVSWRHKAGEVPVCSLELIALKEDGFASEAMTARGEFVSVVIAPGPAVDGAVDVTAMMDLARRQVKRGAEA